MAADDNRYFLLCITELILWVAIFYCILSVVKVKAIWSHCMTHLFVVMMITVHLFRSLFLLCLYISWVIVCTRNTRSSNTILGKGSGWICRQCLFVSTAQYFVVVHTTRSGRSSNKCLWFRLPGPWLEALSFQLWCSLLFFEPIGISDAFFFKWNVVQCSNVHDEPLDELINRILCRISIIHFFASAVYEAINDLDVRCL